MAGLAKIAQTERDFAKLCVARGVAHSFREYFADEGIGFGPHPEKVRDAMAKRPPLDPAKPRAILDWFPVLSDLASSGELGFNLGPSLLTPAPGDSAKPRHGYFFSIWKLQPDGQFKVVLDIGSDADAPLPSDTADNWRPLRVEAWTAPPGASPAAEADALRRQEAALGDAIAASGAPAAYAAVLGTDFRLLENSFRPFVDKDAVRAHLQTIGARGSRRFEPRHVEVARSADFGYAWGAYRATATDANAPSGAKDPTDPKPAPVKSDASRKPAAAEHGYYAHVWRRDASGTWRLVVEVIRPTRPEP